MLKSRFSSRPTAGRLLLLSCAGAWCAATVAAQTSWQWSQRFVLPGTDGPVYALTVFDDGGGERLIVGGSFRNAGAEQGAGTTVDVTLPPHWTRSGAAAPAGLTEGELNLASWNGAAWAPVGGGVGGNLGGLAARVNALAVFDDGRGPALYVGGEFMRAGDVAITSLARWDGAAWEALGQGLAAEPRLFSGAGAGARLPRVLSLFPGEDGERRVLYVGGEFDLAGGRAAGNIAAWDGADWWTFGAGRPGPVHSLAQFDDGGGLALFAGGEAPLGVLPADNIARWTGATWEIVGDTGANSAVYPPTVRALRVFDDGETVRLIAAGHFTHAGGVEVHHVAAWDGEDWASLGDGMAGTEPVTVHSLIPFDDRRGPALYACGRFTEAGESQAAFVARWNGDEWLPLRAGLEGPSALQTGGYALTTFVADGRRGLYVGGEFDAAGGAGGRNVAHWDGDQWAALGDGQGVSGDVRALHVGTNAYGEPVVYAGGRFLSAGGVKTPSLAAWEHEAWRPMGGGIRLGGRPGDVHALQARGADLFVGGRFTTPLGFSEVSLTRWDGVDFELVGGVMSATVRALLPSGAAGGSLYVGGDFTFAGSVQANRIVRWNGVSFLPLGAGFSGGFVPQVHALALYDDGAGVQLYAGGSFTEAGGQPARGLAAWDGQMWREVGGGVSGGIEPIVRALHVHDYGSGPALFVGGAFTQAGGVAAEAIARWDGRGWAPLGAGLSMNGTFGAQVLALETLPAPGGALLVAGGLFERAGHVNVRNLAAWDGAAWADVAGGADAAVAALAASPGWTGPRLFVGGQFTLVGAGVLSYGVACLESALPPLPGDMNCDGLVDEGDIDPFVQALVKPGDYQRAWPSCALGRGDFNGDGRVDNEDIDPFVARLRR